MIASPCIRDCRLDHRFDLCLGCGRTASEIETWKTLSDNERSRVWAELPARRAKLGVKTHRLPWSVEDMKAFVRSTLKPGGGTWVSGVYGAIGEFCIGDEDDIAFDVDGLRMAAKTRDGAISFHLTDYICAFSMGATNAPSDHDVIVLAVPREKAGFAASNGLTCLAEDTAAIRPESRSETLYDFGLGSEAAGFGIRTADPALIAGLNRCAGETHPRFFAAIGKDILAASPSRVIRNAIGRIEIFARIPLPGELSPTGPHTHFLPEHLAQGRDLPPNIELPDAYIPCFIYYPAQSSDDGHTTEALNEACAR